MRVLARFKSRTPARVIMTMFGTRRSVAASPEANALSRIRVEIPVVKSGTILSVSAFRKQKCAVEIRSGSIVQRDTVLTRVSADALVKNLPAL